MEGPLARHVEKEDQLLINLTQRTVTLLSAKDVVLFRVSPSGKVATCDTSQDTFGTVNGIPVGSFSYKNAKGVPEPQKDVVYIVTYAVLQALNGEREDVVAPDTSPGFVVRDGQGAIIGVRRFRTL